MSSVLFDSPGPRGRRLVMFGNVASGVVVAGVVVFVLVVLAQQGQLDPALWVAALDGRAWQFYYLPGLQNTLRAAAFATVGAVAFGVLFGVGRLSLNPLVRVLSGVVVEFFRAVPVLLMMFFLWVFFSRQLTWVPDRPYAAVVVALVLYNGSVIAELVRSGVRNLPRGQSEAALAVGLTGAQSLRSVLLPQALVAMLPAVISQLVVVLKDSALGTLIAYPELLRATQILASGEQNPLQALTVAALVFIVLNWLLSVLAHRLSLTLSSRTSGKTVEGVGIGNPVAAPVVPEPH
ncbi:amino acid ABC transporter permease [Antribacter sp. KLBMP9083]|uniref:Amino acid ABC transporter permease n=1 Tax=Antribacter soli TaxID=2910976 RepID=A0AA41QIS9_9MICO|nr:amino acid ABC transporter permease [Antribacter soli]MCF4122982.1 amino acid ABC transporter permease [Antribacter soli]